MTTIPYRRGDPAPLVFSPRQPDGTPVDMAGMSVQLRISAGRQCIPLDGAPRDDGFDFDLSALDLPPRLYVVSVYRDSGDGWRHASDMFINITGGC